MILKDATRQLIMDVEVFMNKQGRDLATKRKLMDTINSITGESALDAIFVNHTDNFNIPDVVVIPLYHKDFSVYLMDGDMSNVCPFGYTLEIHERTFSKLTPEELSAVILHDILQNVQSCTAKTRFMKAYNAVMSKYPNDTVLDLFSDISASEVMFMAYVDICCRPFKVPVSGTDYVGTDEVIKTMGLGDAYDSYLNKTLPMGNKTPEETIEQTTKEDYRVVKTVISSSLDKDIRHYYTMVKNGVPLVTLDNIFMNRVTVSSLGFVSRKREFQHRFVPAQVTPDATALQETFMNPRSEVELRFQVDKIIADMRYAESEPEREAILIKIKNLSIKLLKTKEQLDKKLQKNPQDKDAQHSYEVVMNLLDELEMLRAKTVAMEIKEKRYGVFVAYPQNYQY